MYTTISVEGGAYINVNETVSEITKKLRTRREGVIQLTQRDSPKQAVLISVQHFVSAVER